MIVNTFPGGGEISTAHIRPHITATRDAVSRAEILGLLGQAGQLSRSEIAKRLGLGPATVTAQIRKLMTDGYVRELAADSRAGAGRPRVPVELIPDAAFVIGISVRPTSLLAVTMLIDGTITNAATVDFDPSEAVVSQFCAVVGAQRAALEHPQRVVAIGISVSGAVDQALSTVRISTTLNWQDFNLGAELQRQVNIPVFVSNDLFALATREVSFGLGHDKDDFLLLGLGYGVGLGIVNHRKVFGGSGGSSTEFGHMSVDPQGPLCVCGNRGCLQVYAGLAEMLRNSAIGEAEGTISALKAALATDTGELHAFLADIGHRLGRSVGGVVNLLGIGTIMVTGETTELWDALAGGFQRGLAESVLNFLRPLDITIKAWTDAEGAVGAAGLALHNAISLNVPLQTWPAHVPPEIQAHQQAPKTSAAESPHSI
ncbi:ROK family transcriptional regulator [Arthrobacter sp. LAPM80]|uniref:ROK family protein n=1 Tax=Arthrobacter sp. LAPM80 TaxID=3141788 RepID=UPI00398B45DE